MELLPVRRGVGAVFLPSSSMSLFKAIMTAILIYSVLAFVALPFQSVGWATGSATIVINPCSQLTALSFENAIISSADEVSAGSNISTPGSCQSSATSSTDVCRVYGVVNTTVDSAVKFEIWLPNVWYGRFLGVGNGGLGGCIDYSNIDYGASLHFATIGSDNGHDGNVGLPFLDHPEVINDYAYRAIHTEAIIGKKIVEAFYGITPSKSYYLGCSSGGRQALQSALLYPDDFDGIVGGSPAADFNHLTGWRGLLGRHVGAPHPQSSPSFISQSLWQLVSQEILNQCDGLDGVMDGIISEPDNCAFNAEALLCSVGTTEGCLTRPQINALDKIYNPIYKSDRQLIYPRYDPGAEGDLSSWTLFDGDVFSYSNDWFKYAIYNDSTYSSDNFGVSDIEYADTINPGGVATWSGDLSGFRNRSGKFLTYHGRRDPRIASGNSKRLHDLIASTVHPQSPDEFYRLFLIPGMGHCTRGLGAWAFGQYGIQSNVVNDTAHNILLALVEWVEAGVPPDSIIGVDDGFNERVHCLYPQRTVWSGVEWICVS